MHILSGFEDLELGILIELNIWLHQLDISNLSLVEGLSYHGIIIPIHVRQDIVPFEIRKLVLIFFGWEIVVH